MPALRRVLALVPLFCLVSVALAIPPAVPQQPGGHFDELGVWVPDEVPSVVALPGPDLGAYRNHSEMAAYLVQLEQTYPGLVDRFSIGQSVRGLQLWAVRITDESIPGPKAQVLVDAAHHGDEVITTEIALRFARDLTAGFATNTTIRALVQERELFIVPMVNPDGVTNTPIATHYATARKNANSVDPNRNYGYGWGGPGSGGPGSDTYRGPTPFSEPETKAIRDLLETHTFRTYVSLHSGAELILWPWAHTNTNHLERDVYDELGDLLTTLSSGVPNGQTSQILYLASGASLDHGAGGLDQMRPMAFSPETFEGSGNAFNWWPLFNPPDADIEPTYQRWKPAMMELLDVTQEYTDATWAAPDHVVTGESFFPAAHLEAPGKRGFRNAQVVLVLPPQLELFSDATLALGDVPQGGVRDPSWIVQANEAGVFELVVRALSKEAMGNLTERVRVEAREVVKYVQVQRAQMGAHEANLLAVQLGGFGLTGVSGRLRVAASDGEVFFDRQVSVPDGEWASLDAPFKSGDRPPGRTVAVMTYDLTGQGPGGPVTRHVEQRAAYTILRPDIAFSSTLPATGTVNRPFTARTTVTNVGSLATEELAVTLKVPPGYVLNNGQPPTQQEPLKPFGRPGPSLVLPTASGGLQAVWTNLTLAAGASLTLDLRLTPVLPGEHTFRADAAYAMTPLDGNPTLTRLEDGAAFTQTVK